MCSLMGLGSPPITEILSRVQVPCGGAWPCSRKGPSSGQKPQSPRPGLVCKACSFLQQLSRGSGSSSAQRTQTGQREQGLGTIPIPSSHPTIAREQPFGAAIKAGAPQPRVPLEVEELQETRMLNYRAALETSSSSSSTVARRGGSRAVNRNCGGSRGEQSEGGLCSCRAARPSLPSPRLLSPRPDTRARSGTSSPRPCLGGSSSTGRTAALGGSEEGLLLHQAPPPMEMPDIGQRAPSVGKETEGRWTRGQVAPSALKKRMWDASSVSPRPDGICPGCTSHPTLTFPVWHLPQMQEVCFQYFAKFYLKMLKLTSHKI